MNFDVITIGGGIGGAAFANTMARQGKSVLVLERETQFRDRVRGENMLPWGVAAARRLGLVDDLFEAGAIACPFFNVYAMGNQTEHRPLPQTTQSGEASLNMHHPEMQKTLLLAAQRAGAQVRRGAIVRSLSGFDAGRTVTYEEDGDTKTASARIVVGADGRSSQVRQWGNFTVERDPNNLRIAGTMLTGIQAPRDGVHLSIGPGIGTFMAPIDARRTRVYVVYIGALGDRKLSGKERNDAFLDAARESMAAAEWFQAPEIIGPLAEFEGADHWVPTPAKPGLALLGDAAGATDPSWGCGLSKTMVDAETLAQELSNSTDWEGSLQRYAKRHDDYFGGLRRILASMTQLIWSGGPEADARRERVFGRIRQEPMAFPDAAGHGPFGPNDEKACRMLLGEW